MPEGLLHCVFEQLLTPRPFPTTSPRALLNKHLINLSLEKGCTTANISYHRAVEKVAHGSNTAPLHLILRNVLGGSVAVRSAFKSDSYAEFWCRLWRRLSELFFGATGVQIKAYANT